MDKEKLLPLLSPRRHLPPISLSHVSDSEDVSNLTPLMIKDRLIFGPYIDHATTPYSSSPAHPSSLLEALVVSSTPRPHSPSFQSNYYTDTTKKKKTNLHRSKTAPAMVVIDDVGQENEISPPLPPSQLIVRQSFVLLLIYLSFGILIYWFNREKFRVEETHPVIDALYFSIVTMCTIGYGDITPNSPTTKLFSIMFVLVGFGFIDILLSGVVSYVLDLHENHLIKTVKVGNENDTSVLVDVKKGRMRIRIKVALALGVVVVCIGVGMCVLHYVETLGWLDSFYLSVMSVTTVGYGDQTFTSLPGRAFACVWLLLSTLAVARAFLYLAEARVDKRNRVFAKWVLGQNMTVAQFLAADIDHNGSVSKSEYVIYKLKEMGKVSEKDILLICKKFDQLDTGDCGKITLADLLHSHH